MSAMKPLKRDFSTTTSLTDDGCSQPKRPRKKSKKGRTKNSMDDSKVTIDSVNCENDVGDSPSSYNKLQSTINDLAAEVSQQKKLINELRSQLSTIVSSLQSGSFSDQTVAALNSYASAVNSRPAAAALISDRAVQESVVAAVYVDTQRRHSRETNFVIFGLPTSPTQPDNTSVANLCRREFNEAPDIVFSKRLGKPTAGRAQPLLVVLRSAAQASRFVSSAKQLRQSTDQHTRDNVYIAANLTKAEARAAYEVRCQRRQSFERRRQLQQHQQSSTSPASNNFQASSAPTQQCSQPQFQLQHCSRVVEPPSRVSVEATLSMPVVADLTDQQSNVSLQQQRHQQQQDWWQQSSVPVGSAVGPPTSNVGSQYVFQQQPQYQPAPSQYHPLPSMSSQQPYATTSQTLNPTSGVFLPAPSYNSISDPTRHFSTPPSLFRLVDPRTSTPSSANCSMREA